MIHPDLPEICYALHEGDVIAIVRGRLGYSLPSNLPAGMTLAETAAWIDTQNAKLGVTPAMREAMVAGSMFSWHVPLADPEKHQYALPLVDETVTVITGA